MKPTIFTLLLAAGLSLPCIANAQMTSTAPTAQAGSSDTGSTMNPRNLSSSQITQLQQTLKSQGYNVTADGVWGQNTVSALKKFQTAKGLPSNGTLNSETVAGLGIDLNLSSNSSVNGQNQSNNSAATNNNLSPAAGGVDNDTSSSTSNSGALSGSANDNNATGGAASDMGTGSTSDTGVGSASHSGTGSSASGSAGSSSGAGAGAGGGVR